MSSQCENECQKRIQDTELKIMIEKLCADFKDLKAKVEEMDNKQIAKEQAGNSEDKPGLNQKPEKDGSKSKSWATDSLTLIGNTISDVVPNALKHKRGLPALFVCGGFWVEGYIVKALKDLGSTSYLAQCLIAFIGVIIAVGIIICFLVWTLKDPDRHPDPPHGPPGSSKEPEKNAGHQQNKDNKIINSENGNNMTSSIKDYTQPAKFIVHTTGSGKTVRAFNVLLCYNEVYIAHRKLLLRLALEALECDPSIPENIAKDLIINLWLNSKKNEEKLEGFKRHLNNIILKELSLTTSEDKDHLSSIVISQFILRIIQKRKSVFKLKITLPLLKKSEKLYLLSINSTELLDNSDLNEFNDKFSETINKYSDLTKSTQVTIHSQPDPLVIVDKFPFDGRLTDFNP